MKILFLSDIVPYPPNTGIKIRTFNIIKGLHDNGNEVFLLAFNHKIFISDEDTKNKYRVELEKVCQHVRILEIPSEKDIFSKYLLYCKNIFQSDPYRVRRYYSDECCIAIKEILENKTIDLCHIDKLEFYKYAALLNSIPIYATNHNIESDLMRQRVAREQGLMRKFFAFMQWKKMEKYEQFALNKVAGYVTCTEYDATYFRTKYGIETDYMVVENGVDLEYYQPSVESSIGNYFLIIGAQNKESTANFDATWFFLKKIWPLVRKKIDVKIKIVGRNPDQSILDYAEGDDRIEVSGYVDDERDLFRGAIALLVPLRIGGGSRLKILTAFGLGKTVISTSKGAEGIEFKDGKNILISDSAEDFTEMMIKTWNDKELVLDIGESARKLALEKYDWKILGEKLNSFYHSRSKMH